MFLNVDPSNIEVSPLQQRARLSLVDQLAEYPVALIGDVRGRVGMMTSAIRPQTGSTSIAGSVLPVLTREGDNLAIHRALDEAKPGDVLLIDAHGETNRAVFGDLLGEICLSVGVRGVIIDGATRDVADLEAMGLPVYARAINPAGPAKAGPGTVGFPVAVGGVVCHPGWAVVADRDGVILIPSNDLETVLERVKQQEEFEEQLRERIRRKDHVVRS